MDVPCPKKLSSDVTPHPKEASTLKANESQYKTGKAWHSPLLSKGPKV